MLASGRGRPEWACAPSPRLSGISRRALGPWGHASALSPSLKGDGGACPWCWRQVRQPFSHHPPGDKVALGETVRRVLSASSTPRVVFGGEDARRRLARKASRWTRAAWGLFLASLAAWPSRQPGARCLSSSLAPPQDRENCHAGGNVFVPFDGFAPVTLCNLYLH